MNIVIEKAEYIITPTRNGTLSIRSGYDLVLEDGIITCLDKSCEKPRDHIRINGRDKIILPSFINIHTHLTSLLPTLFLSKRVEKHASHELAMLMLKLENMVDEKLAYMLSKYLCIKSLISGFSGLMVISRFYENIVKACNELGLTIISGPILSSSLDKVDASVYEREKLVPVITLYAEVLTSSNDNVYELISRFRERKYRVAIHFTGTRREVFKIKKVTGKWPLELLYEHDVLGKDVVLMHLNWVSSMEIGYLSETRPLVSLTPSTTMFYGERGFTPVYELISREIPVTIGTEGVFNSDLNPLVELRTGYLLYKYSYGDNRVDHKTLLLHTLRNPYIFLGLGTGFIEEDSKTSINIYPIMDPLTHDPISYLYISFPKPDYVIMDGKITYSYENRDYYTKQLMEYSRKLASMIPDYLDTLSEYHDF